MYIATDELRTLDVTNFISQVLSFGKRVKAIMVLR